MTENAGKDRKEMEAKLTNVFHDKLGGLSTELREILLDDMVKALKNKLNVLNRASAKSLN